MSAGIMGFGIGLFVGFTVGFVVAGAMHAHARDEARLEAAIREDMDRVDRESREIAAEYRRRREAMRAQSLTRKGA